MSKAHLIGFMIHSPMNHTINSWAHPSSTQGTEFTGPAFWQRVARMLEMAAFDGMFFADSFGIFATYKGSPDPSIRYGVVTPQHDPVVLAPMLAAVTRHLGFATTMSTMAHAPYVAARTFGTLDHLTEGRIGWNVVTGHNRAEHLNLGLEEIISHDERYDRADEYMEICYKLWDSWAPDAIVADKEAGIYANPAKVKPIRHRGKYFRCEGPFQICRSPQGRPVIFQAGSSPRGRDFAARHAEVVFASQPTIKGMRAFVDDMHRRVRAAGRDPRSFKILFGMQMVLGDTEEAAKARAAEMEARIPLEAALARFSGTLGFDFSQVDPDQELRYVTTEGSRGSFETYARAYGEGLTVRQAAMLHATSIGMPKVIGTPEHVADQMEAMIREGCADGFNITPTDTPDSWLEITERVVPILQKRGLVRKDYAGKTFRDNLMEE